MLKLNIADNTLTAGSVIPISADTTFDNRFYIKNNVVYIREPGKVEVIGGINIKATATGAVAINILEGSNIIATYSAVASTIGDVITIPLYELFRVIPTNILNGYANISFTVADDTNVSGGIITLKYIR